jgi:hypothetical protein
MYRPIIFEGKVMDQNDINQGRGAAKELVDYREATGEQALWTNSMFGGMPTYLTGLQWSGGAILNTAQKILLLGLPRPVGENFLAFLTFYLMLLVFGVRPYLALGGALCFGLSTFFVISIQAGHMWKIRAIAYMPLVIAGVKLIFDRKLIAGFVLTTFGLALEINANHPQITYYLFLLLLFYGISELIFAVKNNRFAEFIKIVGILAIAAILAVGSNFGKLWATYEYGQYSIRGKSELSPRAGESKEGLEKDYVFRWSNGKWETMMLYIPHIYGGASGVYDGSESEVRELLSRNNVPKNEINQIERVYLGYWGDLPGTAGPAYVGAAIIFLFILALFTLDNKYKYWMIALVIFSIILSWGKNFPAFNNLMYDLFPAYNKFRAVTMVIVLALLVIPLMAMLGLEKFIEKGWNKENKKRLFLSLLISVGVAFFVLLVTQPPAIEGIQKAIADAISSDRSSIIKKDVFRSILYVLLAFGSIYLLMVKKISGTLFYLAITLIFLLDLGLVDSRYLNDSVYKAPQESSFLTETPADTRILEDKSLGYRVLNLQDPFNEARTSYFHKSIGGYHGAKIRRYQDLISAQLVPEIQQIISDQKVTKSNTNVISMLNAKYILAGLQANAVIPNPYANGAAWFVDEIKTVNSPDEELEQLNQVDLQKTAVLDQSKFTLENRVSPDTTATISMIEYQPNELTYKASTNSHALAVFSEIYYPEGWKAFIDDKQVEIKRANYILRALEIPPGEHTIKFIFEPKVYYAGNKIMLISSLILVIIIGYGIFALWKSSKPRQPEPA